MSRACSPLGPLIAVVVLTLCAAGQPVGAAPPGAALRKFEEGTKAFASAHYDAALKAFLASMELEPSPNTRFKIAKCYVALGKTASAYVSFKRAAQEAQDRVNATGEKRFLPTRDAALAEAAALENKVPKLTLVVPSDIPEGFTLSVDGGNLPQSLWGMAVESDPGRHTIVAEGPRIKRFNQTVDLHQGEFRRVDIPIVRIATATLRLVFETRPAGLAVSLDGQPLPPENFDRPQFVDVGSHKLTVSAPGYLPFVWKQSLHDNESISIPVALEAGAGGGGGVPKVAVFVVGGAALVTLAIGIGFGVKAQSAADGQLALDPLLRPMAVQDAIRTDATIANVLYGTAGALALTAGILAVTARWKTPASGREKQGAAQASFRLLPALQRDGAGLVASGRF